MQNVRRHSGNVGNWKRVTRYNGCSCLSPNLLCSPLAGLFLAPPTFSTHLSHDPSSLWHLPLTSVSNIPVKSKKLSNIQHPTSCISVYNSLGTNSHSDDLRTNATTTFCFPNASRCRVALWLCQLNCLIQPWDIKALETPFYKKIRLG